MKKTVSLLLCVFLLSTMLFTACGTKPAEEANQTDDKLKVVLLIPGSLGDKSFFDSANRGMGLIKEELDAETKVIEMGSDRTKWEPTLVDVSEQDWDLIISGTWQMTELLNQVAEQYPDKRYINFDTSDEETADNVYSMFYRTNEVSFLAGALAGLVTTSDMPLANEEKIIGFLGGMDNPGINDFLVGYIEGAQYIDKDIKVAISYVGNWNDPGKGKEMTLAQYKAGSDIGFSVAGQTGLGQLDAAKELDKYAIGVDSDQALLFKETDPQKAEHIASSALKNIGEAILRASKKYQEGSLEFGKYEVLGFKENGVGLAKNEYFDKIVPEDIKTKLAEIETKLTNGEIKVSTAFGLSTEEIDKIRNTVKP